MESFNYHEYRAALKNAIWPGQRDRLLKSAEADPQIRPDQLKKLRQYAARLEGRK